VVKVDTRQLVYTRLHVRQQYGPGDGGRNFPFIVVEVARLQAAYLVWSAVSSLPLLLLRVPRWCDPYETSSKISAQTSRIYRQRDKAGDSVLHGASPFCIEAMVCLYSGNTVSFHAVRRTGLYGIYHWSTAQTGFVQCAIVIGECIGWSLNTMSRGLYFASASRITGVAGAPVLEARLYIAVLGGVFGCSCTKPIHEGDESEHS
jgi:hypothetical protein